MYNQGHEMISNCCTGNEINLTKICLQRNTRQLFRVTASCIERKNKSGIRFPNIYSMQSRQAHLLTSHRTGLWLQCWRWRWLCCCFCCWCCWNWCWRWFWRWLYFEPDVILDPPVTEVSFHLKLFLIIKAFLAYILVFENIDLGKLATMRLWVVLIACCHQLRI